MAMQKILASVKASKDDDGGPGGFDAIISTGAVDRDGEVLLPGAFNPLPEHITVDMDHGLSVASTVGSGEPYYDGEVLKVKGRFASTALGQTVRTLVKEGHIRTMSVAFRAPKEAWEDRGGVPHLTKGELLNVAFVGVPANPEAAVLAAKSFVEALNEKVGARNSVKDTERIQGAHDLFVDLGAACGKSHTPEPSAETNPEHAVKAAAPAAAVTASTPAAVDVGRVIALAMAELALLDL